MKERKKENKKERNAYMYISKANALLEISSKQSFL